MSDFERAKKLFTEGLEFFNNEKYIEAEKKFLLSNEIFNNRASILLNLAATQIKLKKLDLALNNLQKIVNIEPSNSLALMNIANVYVEKRNFNLALNYINQAIFIDKKNPELLSNKASIYRFQGELEKAIDVYNQALAIKKNYGFAKFNMSICQLSLENFKEGWANYEYRDCKFDEEIINIQKINPSDKILILSEQGIGDVIMFSSLLNFLNNYENIIFMLDHRLIKIFSYSFPKIKFYNQNTASHMNFLDYKKIRIGSFAQFFISKFDDFEIINKPFLKLPPDIKIYEKNLFEKDKLNIGLYWSSSSKQPGKIVKIDLYNLLRELNLSNKNLISLQEGDHNDYLDVVETKFGIKIKRISKFNLRDDFDQLSLLINQCDLIISISTTIVHLAGAFGIPAIILTQFAPDWRYFKSRDKLSWYKNCYILKQKSIDDWSYPFSQIEKKIAEILNKNN